jgi:hypothetical protein
LFENRDNATAATQDVPKPHSYEFGITFAGKRLAHELSHALGQTHYAGRVHRLVCGYQHKLCHASGRSSQRDRTRPKDIVTNGFANVTFHDWNVFMCSRVKDYGWMILVKSVSDRRCVAYVGEDHARSGKLILCPELAVDCK